MSEREQPTINAGLNWRANSFAVSLPEVSRRIVFSSPLEDEHFAVFIFPHNVNLVVTEANKSAEGFIIDILLSLEGDFNYLAIPYN